MNRQDGFRGDGTHKRCFGDIFTQSPSSGPTTRITLFFFFFCCRFRRNARLVRDSRKKSNKKKKGFLRYFTLRFVRTCGGRRFVTKKKPHTIAKYTCVIPAKVLCPRTDSEGRVGVCGWEEEPFLAARRSRKEILYLKRRRKKKKKTHAHVFVHNIRIV